MVIFNRILGLLLTGAVWLCGILGIAAESLSNNRLLTDGFLKFGLAKIDARNLEYYNTGYLACTQYLVTRSGKEIHYGTQGFADIEAGQTAQRDSIFRMMSMSKPIASVAILMQAEKGLLNLDDPVAKYIPAMANMQIGLLNADGSLKGTAPAQMQITIRHLLTHSAGFGSGEIMNHQPQTQDIHGKTLAQMAEIFPQVMLEFEPGTAHSYSGLLAFDLLGYLVELTSGQPLDAFLQENLFDPLEMADTGFTLTETQKSRLARVYASSENGFVPMAEPAIPSADSYFSLGAGLYSTIQDYYNLCLMLLQNGTYNGKHILQADSVTQLRSIAPGDNTWGLGVRVVENSSIFSAGLPCGSYGWSGAYGTHFWIDPENEIIGIYFSNMGTSGGAGAPAAVAFEKDVMGAFVF